MRVLDVIYQELLSLETIDPESVYYTPSFENLEVEDEDFFEDFVVFEEEDEE